ncbi:ankyrin repeat domain-containing protein [Candidatus Babeliales bacterium]|nr:ankyrin repeat domain-containing protein [Candidatus Babeliales bacterium]
MKRKKLFLLFIGLLCNTRDTFSGAWFNEKLSTISNIVSNLYNNIPNSLEEKNEQLKKACEKTNFEKVKALVEAGAELDYRDKHNNTILHDACRYANYKIVKYLISSGAKINATNESEFSSLHLACARRDLEMVILLLKSGASPNVLSLQNQSPLNSPWPSKTNKKWNLIIEALIMSGADVNTEDCYGNTPLQRAYWYNSLQLFDSLVKAGAKVDKNTDKKPRALFLVRIYFNGKLKEQYVETRNSVGIKFISFKIKRYLKKLRSESIR